MHAAFALHQSRTAREQDSSCSWVFLHATNTPLFNSICTQTCVYTGVHVHVYICSERKREWKTLQEMRSMPQWECQVSSLVHTHLKYSLYCTALYTSCVYACLCVWVHTYIFIWYDPEVSRRKRQQIHKLQEALRKHGKAQAASWKRRVAFFHCSASDLS